jgi:xanthine dehydrogenase accessory factor
MKHVDFWIKIAEEFENKRTVILFIVAQSTGSTPGNAGFKMAMKEDGKTFGTIGGGKIEYDFTRKASSSRNHDILPMLEHYSLISKISDHSDEMVCGGKQSVILIRLQPMHLTVVSQIISTYQSYGQCSFEITSDNVFRILEAEETPGLFEQSHGWKYVEQTGNEPVIHIVGGGHVSLALSQVLSLLNYHVIVYDERCKTETFVMNTMANEKKCVPFDQVHHYIEESPNAHILIMTPGHRQDECVLRNTLNMRVAYIGMMASRKKRHEILSRLRNDGFSEESISRLRSPVGLPINSSTPSEIAISIAAELIRDHNSKK